MNREKDKMPPFGTNEANELAVRISLLSAGDICDLLDLVGIRFPNTTREELEEADRLDMADLIVDEADSRAKVEKFLKDRGV